jgi:protein farnesyltransferase/geranylgeranyltransferase type-1 subunit alpha
VFFIVHRHKKITFFNYLQVTDFAEDLFKSGIRSPYLLAFLVDLYIETYQQALEGEDEENHRETSEISKEDMTKKVFQLCTDLSTKFDVIRAKYWTYLADSFRAEIQEKTFTNTVNNKDSSDAESVQC